MQAPLSPTVTNLPITTVSPPGTSLPQFTPVFYPPVSPSPIPSPDVVVTSTIPIDCKRESEDYWNCFEPGFMEGKGKVCRPDCMRECTTWLGHSRGLFAECQEAMKEVIRIYPADVSLMGFSQPQQQPTGLGILPGLLESEGILPRGNSPRYYYSPENSPFASRSTFLEVNVPYIYLTIETPGYYLLPDGQHRLRYYISHFVTPVKLNDEVKWKIQPTLGDDGRPLTGISGGRLEEDKASLLDINTASEEICNLMGTSNLKSLILNLEIPESSLQALFIDRDEMMAWWPVFKNRVRVFKGRTAWFPPAQSGGFGDIAEEFLYFEGNDSTRPYRWSLRLSLRHLLLFFYIKTKPEGTDLTRLEKRSLTYSTLPSKVTSFMRNFKISHG